MLRFFTVWEYLQSEGKAKLKKSMKTEKSCEENETQTKRAIIWNNYIDRISEYSLKDILRLLQTIIITLSFGGKTYRYIYTRLLSLTYVQVLSEQ